MGRWKQFINRATGIRPTALAGLALTLGGLSACSTGSKPTGLNASNNGDTNNTLSVDDHTTFHIVGPVGGPFPDSQRPIVLTNEGEHTSRWEADASVPWLLFSKDEGVLGRGQSERIVVSIDQAFAAALSAGEYLAEIAFQDQDVPEGRLAIEFVLTVFEPSTEGALIVTPEEDFETEGSTDGTVSEPFAEYRISNIGGESLQYSIASSQAWLFPESSDFGVLEPGQSASIRALFDTSYFKGLGEGLHTAVLEFANISNGSGTSRRQVNLELSAEGRVTDGLVLFYGFDEGSGNTVNDSGDGLSTHLTIEDPANVTWGQGTLTLMNPTRLVSSGPASKLNDACRASNQVTIEAWVRPTSTEPGPPARIVSLSSGAFERNFSISQGIGNGQPANLFEGRLRTTQTDQNGLPATSTNPGTANTQLTHVVFTRDVLGNVRFYINAALARSATVAGNFSNWTADYGLVLGNEAAVDRPWLGTFHLVAAYDRALSQEEVLQNFEEGTQDPASGFLLVTPASDFAIQGIAGGDFTPDSKSYVLTNTGTASLNWEVVINQPWIRAPVPSIGFLAPGESAEAVLRIDEPLIQTLAVGSYTSALRFTNLTNNLGSTERTGRLTVNSEGGSGDKPGPHNTGPYDDSNLQPMAGGEITTPGVVIENVFITGGLYIKANNVTVRNFRMNVAGATYGFRLDNGNTGILIEDGEIYGPDSAGIYGGGFTARRLNIHHSGHDAIKSSFNVVVENCWLHSLGLIGDAHADGNQTRQGSHLVFRNCNFDMPVDDSGPFKSNACLINMAVLGPIDDFLIEGCWLNGGNYTVYFEDKGYGAPTNVRMINNRFGRDYRYGVLRTDGYLFASGNVWDDTGELMDINND